MSETPVETPPSDSGQQAAPTPADMDAAIRAHMAQQRGTQPADPPPATSTPPPASAAAAAAPPADDDGADGDQDSGRDASKLPRWAQDQLRKARDEAAKYRTQVRELEPLAQVGRELDAASKTDLQRHEEARLAAEQEAGVLRTQVARMTAAAQHGIPADLVDLLGTGTAEEIGQRAELLASKLAAAQAPPPQSPPSPAPPVSAPPSRPVEALRPGGAPGDTGGQQDPDAWLRRSFGRG